MIIHTVHIKALKMIVIPCIRSEQNQFSKNIPYSNYTETTGYTLRICPGHMFYSFKVAAINEYNLTGEYSDVRSDFIEKCPSKYYK